MEKGVITDPSRETLNRIAGALEVDPEVLYDAVLAADPEALPSLPTYFRAKYRLSDEEISRVEAVIAETGKRPKKPKKSTTTERRSP
jgi:transcriptional regulator with XRE-family HTH domain